MEFKTKLDFSTRQVRQNPETFSVLSGGTVFGLPFSALEKGPDLTTTITASTTTGLLSTFSGNSGITVYSWYTPAMDAGNYSLSALTPSNSGTTQIVGPVYSASVTTVIDGNSVALAYSGVSFDVTPQSFFNLGSGNYSGTVYTNNLYILSAGTLDYTGRTIWVDVSGITRTDKLIVITTADVSGTTSTNKLIVTTTGATFSSIGSQPSAGALHYTSGGTLTTNTSDARLKTNIEPIKDALSKILQLNGVYYNWYDNPDNNKRIGFIAQDVQKIVPELVFYNNNTPEKFLGVHYDNVASLLVEAVKELVNGGVSAKTNTQVTSVNLSTQTVVAEDNNIELNYNGSRETAIGGGFIVLHALGENKNAEFITDIDGNWITNTTLKPAGLIIPLYTPTSSSDVSGNIGDLVRDEEYMYIKTSGGWKRTKLEEF